MANFIAIDLDAQGLYVVAGSARGGVKITHAIPWTSEDDEAPPPLTAETAKAVGEKLRDKLRAAAIPPAPVLVTVGRDRIILKELKYPPVAPAEEPALVRFQAMKEMSESPDDIVLDYAPLGEAGGERRAMAVVMRKDLFNAIQAMCQAMGLKLAGVTPRPYAVAAGLVRAFASGAVPPPADKGDAVVALTISPAGGEFNVVRRGEVTFTLAIPAPVVANDAMLVAQVRRNLAVYAGQFPGHPVQAVYLAEVSGRWVDKLGAALGVPVHAFDPLGNAVPAVDEPLRGRFAGAVGLLAGRATDALPINFASPRQPTTARDPAKRRLALVALAALILIFAGLGSGFFFVNRGEARVNDLAQKRDDLKKQLDAGTPDANRLKAIDGWTKREVNWLEELYELADRMPQDDSVRVLVLTGTPITPGKDGKQEAHANLELKVAATSNKAGGDLASAFERDNTTPNKFYVGTSISYGGTLPASFGKHNQSITIKTKINHREPADYEKNTAFVPLKKTSGGAGVTSAPPPPDETARAPAPTEKTPEN